MQVQGDTTETAVIERLMVRAAQARSMGLTVEDVMEIFVAEGHAPAVALNATRAGDLLVQSK